MHVRSLGYRTDLALLRMAGSDVDDRGDHLVVRSPQNPTHWWGNFVLVSGVPERLHSDRWLERFHAEFPMPRMQRSASTQSSAPRPTWQGSPSEACGSRPQR